MRALALSALALASVPAMADSNRILFVCRGTAPQLVQHFYDKEGSQDAIRGIQELRLTIGQDQNPIAPLFKIRVEALDVQGQAVLPGKTLSRVALSSSRATQNVSLTYAPNRATGEQQVDPFGLLITDGTNGKLRFSQLGDTSRIAKSSFDLSCQPEARNVAVPPRAVDLDSLTESEQIETLETLVLRLPARSQWADYEEGGLPLPIGAYASALDDLRAYINGLNLSAEDLWRVLGSRRRDQANLILSPNGQRCDAVKLEWLRPVRDYTGRILAHKAIASCSGVAATLEDPDYVNPNRTHTEKYAIRYVNFYITKSRVLHGRAEYEFRREYDEN